ncbi:hypothetical protein GRJ2_001825300 [Grus japonensis]|uniref:Uncharacterized protein n=1 Tax=Grus japonensis TaxID=30415 RepID=A0ABC9X7D3_GRUJA
MESLLGKDLEEKKVGVEIGKSNGEIKEVKEIPNSKASGQLDYKPLPVLSGGPLEEPVRTSGCLTELPCFQI